MDEEEDSIPDTDDPSSSNYKRLSFTSATNAASSANAEVREDDDRHQEQYHHRSHDKDATITRQKNTEEWCASSLPLSIRRSLARRGI
mmetsp:Transcript_6169/g.8101  ORF Transcript_6169/g.8101 Transcript_6169/m.8101 type:complete len:88 (+) Transcript_6169:628-891(+)